MPAPNVPAKTPLGQEELRRRTGGLGQRHRTLLFLIDGRRPLSEVLSLALQAGAATSHFEDLVRLGFVEMPAEPPPAPVEIAHAPAQTQITHLIVDVAEPAPEAAHGQVPPAPPALEQAPALPQAAAPRTEVAPAAPPAAQVAEPVEQPVPPDPPAAQAPAPPATPPATAPAAPPPPPPPPPPPQAQARPVAYAQEPPPVPPAAPPRATEELPLLEHTRDSLLEALRHDQQPAGARIAERLRQAATAADMIEAVWVMERGLSHSQRSHRGLLALQRARELLGLGNTLVDEDSRPNRLDEWS